MDKPTLIHKHKYGTGGIGDFFRGIITLYQICKNENIDYYIDLHENPHLNDCFVINNIPEHIKSIEYEEHNLIDIVIGCNENHLINLINYIKNNKHKIHYLLFNGYGNFDFINQNDNIRFIKNNIISPKHNILEFSNKILSDNNLFKDKYISIHFRCGDIHMANENNSNFNNGDNRIDINNTNTVQYYDNLIKSYIDKYNINLPVVIHSDSNYFKNKLKELNDRYIILDIDIQHVANCLGKNDTFSYISTISEFYIISNANSVVMLDVYSGFPHIACLFGNNKLYTNMEKDIFYHLKPTNLIKM